MVKITAFVTNHPELQTKITSWMEKHPRIYKKMRREVLGRVVTFKRGSRHAHSVHIGPEQAELESQILKASEKWVLGRRIDG